MGGGSGETSMAEENTGPEQANPAPTAVPEKPEEAQNADIAQSADERQEQDAEPTETIPKRAKALTKEDVSDILTGLLADMRGTQKGWLAAFGFSHIEARFDRILAECLQLQKELPGIEDQSKELIDFQARVYKLEAKFNRLRIRFALFPCLFIALAVLVGGGLLLVHSGLLDYLKDSLRIRNVMRHIMLGVAGALLYLLTSLMTSLIARSERQPGGSNVSLAAVRFLLAVLVPVVIVMVVFNTAGEAKSLGKLWKSPEVLSFLCGYSATLVVEALNKLVDKARVMIRSL